MKSGMCRVDAVLYVLTVLLTVSGAVATTVKGESSRFQAVASGIEHATFRVQPGNAEPFLGHAFKIDLGVAELRLVPAGGPLERRTVAEIVAPYPAVVAINASFFDKEGRTMGLAVDEGRLIASNKRQSWGALVVDDKKARIMLGGDIYDALPYPPYRPGHPPFRGGGKDPAAETPDRRADRGVRRRKYRRARRLDEGRSHCLRALPCRSA